MKNLNLKNLALTGLICALFLPATGFASVEADVKAYLEGKNPQSISDYPPAFSGVYENYVPLIKESTQVTVIYYFSEADVHTYEDIATLTGYAVTAAIAESRKDGNEDDLAAFITDAVCGSFKGGLRAAYKQVASAENVVKGGLTAALDAGVPPDFAATAVSRGIDSCMEEKLEYEVALVLGQVMSGILGARNLAYNYKTPYTSYLPPGLKSGPAEILPKPYPHFPGEDDPEVCVSNCI